MKKIIIPAIIALVFLAKTATAQTVALRQPARRMIVVKPCLRIVAAPWHYVRPLAFAVPPLRPARVVIVRR